MRIFALWVLILVYCVIGREAGFVYVGVGGVVGAPTPDFDAPTFDNCPADIEQNTDPGQAYAVVSWTAPTATDIVDPSPIVQLTSGPNPGDAINVGTETVTYTATDASSRTAECTFTITVVDPDCGSVICPLVLCVNGYRSEVPVGECCARCVPEIVGICNPDYIWPPVVSCFSQCSSDSDCPGIQKCCSDPALCSSECQDPVQPNIDCSVVSCVLPDCDNGLGIVVPDGECCPQCVPGPDCSLVLCAALPPCDNGYRSEVPDGACCPQCVQVTCEDNFVPARDVAGNILSCPDQCPSGDEEGCRDIGLTNDVCCVRPTCPSGETGRQFAMLNSGAGVGCGGSGSGGGGGGGDGPTWGLNAASRAFTLVEYNVMMCCKTCPDGLVLEVDDAGVPLTCQTECQINGGNCYDVGINNTTCCIDPTSAQCPANSAITYQTGNQPIVCGGQFGTACPSGSYCHGPTWSEGVCCHSTVPPVWMCPVASTFSPEK